MGSFRFLGVGTGKSRFDQIDPFLAQLLDKIKCLNCGVLFSTLGSARRHFKEVHLQIGGKIFSCQNCQKTFKRRYKYQAHLFECFR